jgi:hypothetical protein
MDLHAPELLFYKHQSPVYLAPVYGTVRQTPGGVMSAYPHVPILPALMAIEGPSILDDNDLPDDFTVVPILALEPYQLCFLSHKIFENDHEVLCENIKSYNPYKSTTSAEMSAFRKLAILRLLQDDVTRDFYLQGHCASCALCHLPTTLILPARIDKHVCPGCGFAVHHGCGHSHPDPIRKERLTCHLCFDQFGRAISGPKDLLYMSEKNRKDESKKDDSTKKDPSKQPDFPPTQGSPAENTRAMRPSLRIPTPQRIESIAKEPSHLQLRKW